MNKYVCSDHFAPEFFTDSRRKYLHKYALPIPYATSPTAYSGGADIVLGNVEFKPQSPLEQSPFESTLVTPAMGSTDCAGTETPVGHTLMKTPRRRALFVSKPTDKQENRMSRLSLLCLSGVSPLEITPRKKRMLDTRHYLFQTKKLARQVRKLKCNVTSLKKLLKISFHLR